MMGWRTRSRGWTREFAGRLVEVVAGLVGAPVDLVQGKAQDLLAFVAPRLAEKRV
jgi:hypothetical protein